MFSDKTVAVLIPAYRVEKQIEKVLSAIPDFVDKVIVINDASPDDTSVVVNSQIKKDARIVLLEHSSNQGVGGAMLSGFEEVIRLDIDIALKVDGDNQMDLTYIPALLAPLVEDYADYSKGNRFLHKKNLDQMPLTRFIGSLILTFLTKVASGYWKIFDPQNGYFAIKLETLKKIDPEKIDSSYFFENSMLINLNKVEARVVDVFIPARYLDEESSLNTFVIMFQFPYKLFRGLLSRFFYRYIFFDLSPVSIFALFGTILFGFGTFYGGFLWLRTFQTGIPNPTGSIILTLLTLSIGFQLLLQAILLEIGQSPCVKGLKYSLKDIERLKEKYTKV